jgi:hypothetical protein
MVTVKLFLALLPAASTAVQFTVVTPTGKTEPDEGTHVTGLAPLTRSMAVALNVTTAPLALVAVLVIAAGTVRTGGVVSRTVMVNEPGGDVRPEELLAVQVTVVVPSGKVAPDAWSQDTVTPDGSVNSVAFTGRHRARRHTPRRGRRSAKHKIS